MAGTVPPTQPVQLYGRQAEIKALDSHIRAVALRRGGIVLLEGPAGSGKTSLIDVASRRARCDGVRFLSAAAGPGTREAPLGPLLAVLSDGALPPCGNVRERLATVASRGPLVVAIDDLHAADDATLVALRNLPWQLAGHPILWLLALTPGRADPTTRILVTRGAGVIRLGALSNLAVSELASHILGGAPSEAVLDFVRDLADRPALIVELLQAFVSERLVELADGRARLTGYGLHRAMSELRERSDRRAPELEAALVLTRSERAVVELVAHGATNRQAAERLFLSPHTVSTHLRHTFEKLGIQSRVELAVMFAQRQADGAMASSRTDPAKRGEALTSVTADSSAPPQHPSPRIANVAQC